MTPYIQLQGVTHWLSYSSFISRLTLLTTVSSAATRSTVAVLSSVTLCNSGGKFCQLRLSLLLTNGRRQSACVRYRWSSWPRIAKARSSRVSLNRDKRNIQEKELQLDTRKQSKEDTNTNTEIHTFGPGCPGSPLGPASPGSPLVPYNTNSVNVS